MPTTFKIVFKRIDDRNSRFIYWTADVYLMTPNETILRVNGKDVTSFTLNGVFNPLQWVNSKPYVVSFSGNTNKVWDKNNTRQMTEFVATYNVGWKNDKKNPLSGEALEKKEDELAGDEFENIKAFFKRF